MTNTISQWNHAARCYTEDQETSAFAAANREAVSQRFSHVAGLDILDLGCGSGWYSGMLADRGAAVTACDGSENMLQLAREAYKKPSFLLHDIKNPLPFENCIFDIVLCNQVLMDIEDISLPVSEAARVLRPGGTFWFAIVHPAFYDGRWLEDQTGFKDRIAISRYLSEYSFDNRFWGETRHYHRPISSYLNSAAAAGLRLIKIEEPQAYDGIRKTPEIPLFLYAEFQK